MVAGSQRAVQTVRSIGQATQRVAQTATRSGERIGQAGARAGQKFGRDMAAGVRQSIPQFNRAIDQAARDAQRRLAAVRPQIGAPRAPAPGTFVSADGRLRDARGRYIAGGPRRTAPGGGGAIGGGMGRDIDAGGIGRLWSLSALGGQLRGVTDRARMAADQTVEVASERQVARAEMRTVVEDAGERQAVRVAAREAALGRGGMVVAIDESNFTSAVFRGVASGLQTQRAIELVPVSADLALAGQTTPEQAQIGLTDTGSVFRDRSFRDLGDIYARGQDIGTFLNIGELFSATTKMASTAKAAGLSFEDTVAIAATLSRQGPTFRGATGGQKGLMAIREMELGAMGRLGMTTMRDAGGDLDFAANIRALAAADVSVADINQAFGKRAAPAILALIDDVTKLESTIRDLQDSQGTAADNAREHSDIWRSTLQDNQSAIDVFVADAGEGAIRVREAGVVLKGTLARLLSGIPGAPGVVGGALEVGSIVGQAGLGVLDTAVGVHAFRQLAGGTWNPLNVFRSEDKVAARREQQATRRQQRLQARGLRASRRGWAGLFGTLTRGVGTSRRGFAGLFAGILRGGVKLGGMVAAELTAAFASKAVTRAVGGAGAGAAGAAGATGGAVATTGAVAGAVGAATATGAALAGGLVAPAAVAVASPIALMRRKREAEELTRVQAAANQLTPEQTEAAVAEARAGQRALPRFRAAREEGVGLVGSVLRGLGFGKTVAAGMNADAGTLGAATDQALQPVAQRLPQSDAEIGPLSDLTARGMAIPMTLAAGVTEGAPVLQAAVSEMLTGLGLPAVTAPESVFAPPPPLFEPDAPGESPATPAPVADAEVSLEAAINRAAEMQRQLMHVQLQILEEMRRGRRRADHGPVQPPAEQAMPADVLDYDVGADLLRERL